MNDLLGGFAVSYVDGESPPVCERMLCFFFVWGFFLCSDIPLHNGCGIRNRSAQLDFLPLGADLLVDLRKLLINLRFFLCERLP